MTRSTPRSARNPRQAPRRPATRAAIALAAWSVASALTGSARGASWDSLPVNGVVNGGTGTWDALTPNWTTNGGASNTPWVSGDSAIFDGLTGGVVTVVGNLSVASLTFDPTTDASAYTLVSQTAGDKLTLTGPDITANQDAALNANLAGSVGLSKLGNSTLSLGGANTFTGTIAIAAGKLRATSTGALGAAASMTIANGATFEADATMSFAGTLDIGTGGAQIAAFPSDVILTLSGAVTGTSGAGLTKVGQGTVVLASSSSTFAGPITIAAGTLRVGSDGALGAAANSVTIQSNATLGFSASVDPGALRTIVVGPGGGAIDVAGGATVALADPGQISGSNLLRKTGTGKLVLGAAGVGFPSLTGGLTVSGGTVELMSDTAPGTGALAVTAGGTLLNNSSTLANAIVLGGGTLSFSGNNSTYSGPVTVAANSTISVPVLAKTLTLSGIVSGTNALAIDIGGGGALAITNPAIFNGAANTFVGNIAQFSSGGVAGSAELRYRIVAPAGQTFSASAGTLRLGGAVPGNTITLAAGSAVVASGSGTIELFGQASAAGVGVNLGGSLSATSGGKIVVGNGLDDSAQLQFASTAALSADNGTITLRPRATALTFDASSVAAISVKNGGLLALAGNVDLTINRDIDQAGAWTLANQSPNLLRIVGASQDSTAGLILRAEAGLTRYETDAITIGSAAANGTLNLDLRGGTVDINNDIAGKTFTWTAGYTLTGHGQVGTSAANQTHVLGASNTTFYANNSAESGILSIVGGFNETAGGKAAFRIGDNDALSINVPNASAAAAYRANSVAVDAQSGTNIARFIVAGGYVIANGTSFASTTANKTRFEITGGGLVTDLTSTATLLLTGGTQGASLPISVSNGGALVLSSASFNLKSSETAGGTGSLFLPTGATAPAITLNGIVDLNGTFGGSILAASTGQLRLDAGQSTTLLAAADFSAMTLAYAGASGDAMLEINSSTGTARVATTTQITAPYGAFTGNRAFKVTAGVLQIDAADAATVSINATNSLSVDRTANATADPAVLGTLTLNGGQFQVGTTASTTTIASGALLTGKGTYGHTSAIDTFVNNGTVAASGGQLTISAGTIRTTGTFDPAGQNLVLQGAVADFGVGNPSQLRVIGGNGGTVQLNLAGSFTGGTVIDGSSGTAGVGVKIMASGALGTGDITLNSGTVSISSNSNGTFAVGGLYVSGTSASTLNWERVTSGGGATYHLAGVYLGGQTLNMRGTSGTTLSLNGLNVSAAGAAISQSGSSSVLTGPINLQGALALNVSSLSFTLGSLSGPGSISRTLNSGTMYITTAASAWSGNLLLAGGTTHFNTGSNMLAGGTFTFGGGTVNINSAKALNLSSGTVTQGTSPQTYLNLNVADALYGGSVTLLAGSITANVGNALSSGTVTLGGGRMVLKGDPATSFGGTVNVGGTAASTLLLDRASAGTGANHSVTALNFQSQRLILISNNNYGLSVTDSVVGPGADSTLQSDSPYFRAANLTLNGNLILTSNGPIIVDRLGGAGLLSRSSSGSLDITGAPLPGWSGTVQAISGILNLSTVGGSLAGGGLNVSGSEVNLGVAGAIASTATTMSSGFLDANVSGAMNNALVQVTNGTIQALADNALGNAVITLTGGNVTALVPNSLGTSTITLNDYTTVALRGDSSASFGGSVSLSGTNYVNLSAGPITTEFGPTGQTLTLGSLAINARTVNITGSNDYIFGVASAVPMSGTAAVTFNATGADALFQGALTGACPIIKNGLRTLTLNGGATFGATTVNAGTLVVNGAWTTSGVTVGGSNGAAMLDMGGGGINAPGNFVINSGTIRVSKPNVAGAIPLASTLNVAANGDVRIEYAGLLSGASQGILSNNVTVDLSGGSRAITVASRSSGTSSSAFNFAGLFVTSGANVIMPRYEADTPQSDLGFTLTRAPSRLIVSGAQTFSQPLTHGGGIVIGKGTIPNGASNNPLGRSTAAVSLTLPDSTLGGTVADGQTSNNFLRNITTVAGASRARLGAFWNPLGGAGAQTISYTATFEWNDAISPILAITPAGNPAGAMNVSSWNGLMVDSGVVLQVNSGAILDNVISATGGTVTASAPIYIGGGGTVRIASTFNADSYKNFTTGARGLSGPAIVLDSTTLQSQTANKHFEGVDLRGGTFLVSNVNQSIDLGFAANPSPLNSGANTSTLQTDFNLTLSGTGIARAMKLATGATLLKTGAATLNINGDQLHSAGSTLRADQGIVNFNTNAGMNAGGPLTKNLTIGASNTGTVNLNVTQHVAQVSLGGAGLVKLASSAAIGQKVLVTAAVTSGGTGKLDLTNNHMIVDYTGASSAAGVRALLLSGYNASGARWNGNGIMSSSAAADPTLGLGYAESSEILGPTGGTFAGQTVDSTAILVRYTRMGDANLDATVNFDDLVIVAQNYETPGIAAWFKGDFNYDGLVNFDDLVTVAQNYEQTAAAPLAGDFATQWELAQTVAVPEPSLGLLLTLGALSLLPRQRRKR